MACTEKNVTAHNNLGSVLSDRGQIDDAIAQFQEAAEITPDLALAYSNIGDALTRRGDIAAAIVQYQKALEIEPTYAAAHTGLGIAGRPRTN